MNKHDQRRKDRLIRTLQKAKEQAEATELYLVANDRNLDDIFTVSVALEHIEIALEHLGGAPTCKVCGCTQHNACPGGCWWVEENLCSTCAPVPAQ